MVDATAESVPFDTRLLEQPLSDSERALRDYFVNEYLKDFDPYQACLRCGFLSAFAVDWAKRLMSEGYVQRAIADLTRKPVAVSDAEDRALLESSLREAMQRGPYASRVSAAKAFAELKGWAKPDSNEAGEQALIDVMKEFAQKAPV